MRNDPQNVDRLHQYSKGEFVIWRNLNMFIMVANTYMI